MERQKTTRVRCVRAFLAPLLLGGCCALAAAPSMSNLNPPTRPSSRTGSVVVAGVGADGGEQEVLFGGNALLNTNAQTWTYSPNNWSQRAPPTAPGARAWGVMTWDASQRRAILFGGSTDLNGPLLQDTWAFDPLTDSWVQLTNMGAVPPARFLSAMVYVPHLQQHLLFGGGTATSSNAEATALDNGLWTLSVNATMATATWTALTPGGTPPPARASACYGYDPVRRRLIVFGGEIINDTLADTVEYDVATNTWLAITAPGSPTKRGSAVCTFDQRVNKLALYGGVTTPSGTPQSAAFEYDPSGPLWRSIAPMPNAGSLTFAAPTYSADAGGMMFFGGRTSAIGTSQATWTLRLNGTPRLVLPSALAFDESVLVVLPATVSDVDLTDVHVWTWTQDGGAPVTLSSTSVAQPTFTTPAVTSPRALRFSVVVSDGPESASGFVDVTVRDNVNEEPLVDAGPDQLADAGDLVQLSGSATDPNSEAMTFAWVQRGGPGVTLSSTSVLTPTFIAPGAGGVLVFELSATDARGGADVDSVSIDVRPAPPVDAGEGDAGASDAGPGDAGAGVDAGADVDGGVAGLDAGEGDAGAETDAGLDAGVPTDGGVLDAGEVEADAGVPQKRVLSVGCTCASIDAAPLFLILLGLTRRSREGRSK